MFHRNERKQTSEKSIVKPNKLLGQNFLRDKNVLYKIIAAANLTSNDTILEVGPGKGILTEALAQSAGRVIAVEKDRNLAAALKARFANNKNIKIIKGDILSFLRRQESRAWIPGQARDDNKLPMTNYKVVANIPYYLTSHLIRLLLESARPPQDIILMIQKEVARRICAKTPEMSLLAASVQFYAAPKIIASVSKNAFWPKPKVDSAIIKITPHTWQSSSPTSVIPAKAGIQVQNPESGSRVKPGMTKIEIENFFRIARAGFSHPRKQLLGNLSQELKLSKEIIASALAASKIKNSQRAETLTVENWLTLAKNLNL